MGTMRTLGNILWHIPFLGFLNALAALVFGALLTITVVAAPLGLGLIEYGKFLIAPFGQAMVSKRELGTREHPLWKAYSTVVMIAYLPFGILLTAAAVLQVVFLFCTIVGIPVALVVARSLGTYLNPVGKQCVPQAVADELERRRGAAAVAHHLG